MTSDPRRKGFSLLKVLFLLIPSMVLLAALELLLTATEGWWNVGDDMAPSFVLERQGGLLEIQRRITEEAGTGAGGLLASERMYRPDRELFWRLHPDLDIEARNYLVPREWGEPSPFTIRTNASGLRMARPLPGGKNGTRIVCMGNSCTFGWGVDREGSWPYQLEKLIVSKLGLSNVEVWNAGMPGYTSHQGVRFFESDVAGWDPDILVVSFGFNDSRLAPTPDEELARRRDSMAGRIGAAASRFRTYRLLEKLIRRDRPVPEARARKGPRVPVKLYGANLERLIDEARRRGIRPVLLALVMPEEYRREVGEVARRKGIPLVAPIPSVLAVGEALSRGEIPPGYDEIDMPGGLEGSDPQAAVFADPIHPNRLGNYMIAMQVTRELLSDRLIGGAPSPDRR